MLPLAELTSLPDPNTYSSIGWVIVVLGVIVVMINQVSEMVARHKAKDPDPPLHKEYVFRSEFEAHVSAFEKRFEDLQEDRRRNVTVLHAKIDAMRSDMKSDIVGLHERTNAILAAFSELKGAVKAAFKDSNSPFSR